MKKKTLLMLCATFIAAQNIDAQSVGIGTPTPNAAALLELQSSNKGFLLPRISLTGRSDNTTIANPPYGMLIINTNEEVADGSGVYIQDDSPSAPTWKKITFSSEAWNLRGNYDAQYAKLGQIGNYPLQFISNDQHVGRLGGNLNILFGLNSGAALSQTEDVNTYNNIVIGNNALPVATAATHNIAIGNSAMGASAAGVTGIAIGGSALYSQQSGAMENIAIGYSSQVSTTIGVNNISMGRQSLYTNTSGGNNIAIGFDALNGNRANSYSIAIGQNAMGIANSTATGIATNNIAMGISALRGSNVAANNTGTGNIAIGTNSSALNAAGTDNVTLGRNAAYNNAAGNENVSLGNFANENALGDNNISIGFEAGKFLRNGNNNVFIGNTAGPSVLTDMSSKLVIENIAGNTPLILGDFLGDSLELNAKTIVRDQLTVRGSGDTKGILMGYGTAGKQTDAGKIQYGGFGGNVHWLNVVGGGTNAAGSDRVLKLWSEGGMRVRGNALPDIDNFYSLGQSGSRWASLWAVNGVIQTSDARLKTNISSLNYGLKELMQMNPVQYNWKTNPSDKKEIGFLAQEIQKIIPEAVEAPANGDAMGMKYTELIPVLVKAIQEQQKEIEELKKLLKQQVK